MKLTKERKIFAIVLGAALVALTVDRLTASPESADAATADAAVAMNEDPASLLIGGSTSGNRARSHGTDPELERYSLAERLNSIAGPKTGSIDQAIRSMRDVFRPVEGSRLTPPTPDGSEASNQAIRAAAERFLQTHKLTALTAGNRPAAVVDGKIVQVGSMLDGFRLASVTRQTAVFESAGVQVRLQAKPIESPAR